MECCRECGHSSGLYVPACAATPPSGKPKPWAVLKKTLSGDPSSKKSLEKPDTLSVLKAEATTWAELVARRQRQGQQWPEPCRNAADQSQYGGRCDTPSCETADQQIEMSEKM
eukprot:5301855-Amphidinium_carterae.1